MPRLGLATTYRTLELLRRTGSLHTLFAGGRVRPLLAEAPPPPRLSQLRLRGGHRAVRHSVAAGAHTPPRLPRRVARARDLRHLPELRVNWIAIPLASLTVLSTLAGGVVALRLHRELTTLIALTGGIVSASRSSTCCRRRSTPSTTPLASTGLVGPGFLIFFLAERALVLHHRDDAGAGSRARAGRRPGRGRALDAQLHRRPRDRARVRRRTRRRDCSCSSPWSRTTSRTA